MSKNALKIESRLYNYLKEGLKETGTKSEIIKKTFLLLLRDYFDESLKTKPDLYDLEAFAGDMLYVVNTPDQISKVDPKLADMLDTASDITFYQKKAKGCASTEFVSLLQTLKEYLEANINSFG